MYRRRIIKLTGEIVNSEIMNSTVAAKSTIVIRNLCGTGNPSTTQTSIQVIPLVQTICA